MAQRRATRQKQVARYGLTVANLVGGYGSMTVPTFRRGRGLLAGSSYTRVYVRRQLPAGGASFY